MDRIEKLYLIGLVNSEIENLEQDLERFESKENKTDIDKVEIYHYKKDIDIYKNIIRELRE